MDGFPFGMAYFQGRTVIFRQCMMRNLNCQRAVDLYREWPRHHPQTLGKQCPSCGTKTSVTGFFPWWLAVHLGWKCLELPSQSRRGSKLAATEKMVRNLEVFDGRNYFDRWTHWYRYSIFDRYIRSRNQDKLFKHISLYPTILIPKWISSSNHPLLGVFWPSVLFNFPKTWSSFWRR